MTASDFIDGIKFRVIESTVQSMLENLAFPAGRQPTQVALDASAWFLSLPPEVQNHVKYIIRCVSKSAVFGFCCVIDGVRVIENTVEKSDFRLTSINPDGSETLLNPIGGPMLHDLLNA